MDHQWGSFLSADQLMWRNARPSQISDGVTNEGMAEAKGGGSENRGKRRPWWPQLMITAQVACLPRFVKGERRGVAPRVGVVGFVSITEGDSGSMSG